MAPLVDTGTLKVLASRSEANDLTRETFTKLLDAVKEHVVESLLRKLGFDSRSLMVKMKGFTLVALIFFTLLLILLSLYTVEDSFTTVISGLLPALLGFLLQRPGLGKPRMPSELKKTLTDFLESFWCGSRLLLHSVAAAKKDFIEGLRKGNATEELVEAIKGIDVFSMAKALLNPAFHEFVSGMIEGQRNVKELFEELQEFLNDARLCLTTCFTFFYYVLLCFT